VVAGLGLPRLGRTPAAPARRWGPARLRLHPPALPVPGAPAVLAVACPGRGPEALDLLPGFSPVEALVQAGCAVGLLDLGDPGPEHADLGLQQIVDDLFRWALRELGRAHPGPVLGLGWSFGGTLLTAAAARHPDRVARLAVVSAPVDLHRSGPLLGRLGPLLAAVAPGQNLPAAALQAWLLGAAPPLGLLAANPYGLPRSGDALSRALGAWGWAGLPGQLARDLGRLFVDNALVDGPFAVGGREVAPGRAPALLLAGADDAVVPSSATFGLGRSWAGPLRAEVLPGSHLSLLLSPALRRRLVAWALEPA